jgi:RNA polymerase sigma factor (sigma-70 family)
MNYTKMDDTTLVRHLRKHPGEQAGWMVLLARYQRLIRYHIKGLADTEDLYQDIQLAIWDGLLHRYTFKGKVVSYVGSIIMNHVKQRLKGAQRMQIIEPTTDETMQDIIERIPDTGHLANPSGETIGRESGRRIADLLGRLNPKEQKMLILRYMGYAHEPLCPMLGIKSAGASRKFLTQLVKKIAAHCLKLGIVGEDFRAGMFALFQEGTLHEILSQ